jgi:glutamate/tyrosine decarboxylase-like PLP-dependent enzyme
MPEHGIAPGRLLDHAADVLLQHSVFPGHPRFGGYIGGSPAPIGALADLLASALGSCPAGWLLAPGPTEIEGQTVRWIAELLDYPTTCGGIMGSGENMANFVGVWTALRSKPTGICMSTVLRPISAGRCESTSHRRLTPGFIKLSG